MSNEQLFFGLSQVLRKFPKETGEQKGKREIYSILKKKGYSYERFLVLYSISSLHSDRVLCHFCFKPKKVTNGILGIDNARRSQMLISSIILLKTALDALPLLSKVTIFALLHHLVSIGLKYVLKC